MAKIAMTATAEQASQGHDDAKSRAPVTALPNSNLQINGVGSLEKLREEIDDAHEEMQQFISWEPDEIMRVSAGHSARLNELRMRIQRVEDLPQFRVLKQVRQNELEPTIKELQFQFQVASRLFSVRQLDWEMARGEPT